MKPSNAQLAPVRTLSVGHLDDSSVSAESAEILALVNGLPGVSVLVDINQVVIARSSAASSLDIIKLSGGSFDFRDIGTVTSDSQWTAYSPVNDLTEVMCEGRMINLQVVKPSPNDNTSCYYEVYYYPWYSTDNTIKGSLILLSDVTTRGRSERQFQLANEELTQLHYHLSHDLSAPIASASGLLQMIKDDWADGRMEEIPDLIGETEAQMTRLKTLVTDLMSLAQAGVGQASISTFDVRELIDEIAQLLSCHSRVLELSVTAECSVDTLTSDRIRVKQILTNLISNARKFQDENEKAPEIVIRTKLCEFGTEIQVVDNGCGIRESDETRLFDLFVRGSEEFPGHGLGLFIVRKHVAHLGGHVTVTRLSKPTIFTVFLPHVDPPVDPLVV